MLSQEGFDVSILFSYELSATVRSSPKTRNLSWARSRHVYKLYSDYSPPMWKRQRVPNPSYLQTPSYKTESEQYREHMIRKTPAA